MEVMGSSANSLLDMSRKDAERVVRARIGEIIQDQVSARLTSLVVDKLRSECPEQTLTLRELSARWMELRKGLSTSNGFVGGGTPMRRCMELIESRFKREIASAAEGTRFMLFVVSDGESSDGDPAEIAWRLHAQGVEVVACFVSSADVQEGKMLCANIGKRSPDGARTMFHVASRVPTHSAEIQFLLRSGWGLSWTACGGAWERIRDLGRVRSPDSVKLFAQINHSGVLGEFLRVVIAPLYAEHRVQHSVYSHR